MNWILENWQGILGGGSVTTIITYVVNRKSVKADFLTKVEGIYSKLADDLKSDREYLKEQNKSYVDDIRELRKTQDGLQDQFNTLNIAYTKEVETSQYWRQKNDDLDKKYSELLDKHKEVIKQNEHLEKVCDKLRFEHEKLKKEFEVYKIKNDK